MRVVVRLGRQADAAQHGAALFANFVENALFVGFIVAPLLGEQFCRQHHISQRRILWEQVERLKHQPEVELIGARLRAFGTRGGGIKNSIAAYADGARIRALKALLKMRGVIRYDNCRGPLRPLSKEEYEVLERVLDQYYKEEGL